MKAKAFAKKLRARSDEFHRTALVVQDGDKVSADRARLLADVLQEIADLVAPRSKKKMKKEAKRTPKLGLVARS